MNKELIISRLKATEQELRQLAPEHFYYGTYVSKSNHNCGTVCCAAGWYPKWFPEAGIEWWELTSTKLSLQAPMFKLLPNDDVELALIAWHGVGIQVVDTLFYGDRMLDKNGLTVGFGEMYNIKPTELADLFSQVIYLIENEQIDYLP